VSTSEEVLALYGARLAEREAAHHVHDRRHAQLANARLGCIAAAVLLAYLAFGPRAIAPAWLSLPAIAYAALAVWHERVLQQRRRAARAAADAEALRDAYQRGSMPLPAALAALREVFGARRTVADARAEATLATLDLLAAIGAAAVPEEGR